MKRVSKDRLFVSIQFLLFFIYIFPTSLSLSIRWDIFRVFGMLLAVMGVITLIVAMAQLGASLSPFPTPRKGSHLVNTGLFKWVRHPIYTGIMMVTLGYAIYSDNLLKLFISIGLLVLFHFKSNYEEDLLEKEYPDYAHYKQSTGKFLPRLFG